MAQNFYKYDNSYYKAGTHEKILTPDDLKALNKGGGKEITYAPDSSWEKIANPQAISQYDVKGQFGSTLYGVKKAAPTLPATLDSSTISKGLNSDITSNLPPTTSQTINEAFLNSSTANVEAQKKNIYDIYQKQAEEAKAAKEKAQAEIDALRKQQEETLKKTDPTKSQYYDQQQRITQDRLDAAEAASGTLEENYMNNQNSITELETLLKTAQAKIEAEKARPALESVSQGRVNRIQTDYAGRVGVLQAVMSARNGQINMANTLIDEAFDTVSSQRTDYLNYANAVLNLMSTKVGDAEEVLIQATADEKDALKNQISMVETELKEAEETKQTIMELMIEQPDLADKAGLSLSDTKEQIAQKIQTYYKANPEANPDNTIETLDGYKWIVSPTNEKLKRLGYAYAPSSGGGGTTGTGNTIKIGNTEIPETGDTFTDTVNYLRALRDQGMLNDFNYKEQINSLMELGGYDDTQRGEVESLVNQAMEGKLATNQELEEDNNPASDFIVSGGSEVFSQKEEGGKSLEERANQLINRFMDAGMSKSKAKDQAQFQLKQEGYPADEVDRLTGNIIEKLFSWVSK